MREIIILTPGQQQTSKDTITTISTMTEEEEKAKKNGNGGGGELITEDDNNSNGKNSTTVPLRPISSNSNNKGSGSSNKKNKTLANQGYLPTEQRMLLNQAVERFAYAYDHQDKSFGAFYSAAQTLRNLLDKFLLPVGVAPQYVTTYDRQTGLYEYNLEKNKSWLGLREKRKQRQAAGGYGSASSKKNITKQKQSGFPKLHPPK